LREQIFHADGKMGTRCDGSSHEREKLGTLRDEDIIKWISEGWRFRVKTSHGKRYITRRRGGTERSVCAFQEDVWKRIMAYVERAHAAPPLPRETFEDIKALREEVKALSTKVEAIAALLPQSIYGKRMWLFSKIGQLSRQIRALKEWSSQIEDEMLDYEVRLSEAQTKIRSLEMEPINGLYERFECSSCRSKHLVAVKIKCTKCGAENWWGYWPQKP
jgi:hypothetical protein